MNLEVKQSDNGILIWTHFVYAPQKNIPWIINLQLTVGAEMAYDRWNLLSIDFPWEYDIDGILISAFVGSWERLNYLITRKGEEKEEKIWIIQSPEVLERGEIGDMDLWLYSDESVAKKLDQLELEWERLDLNTIPFGLSE